jgi:hypothetical protein
MLPAMLDITKYVRLTSYFFLIFSLLLIFWFILQGHVPVNNGWHTSCGTYTTLRKCIMLSMPFLLKHPFCHTNEVQLGNVPLPKVTFWQMLDQTIIRNKLILSLSHTITKAY